MGAVCRQYVVDNRQVVGIVGADAGGGQVQKAGAAVAAKARIVYGNGGVVARRGVGSLVKAIARANWIVVEVDDALVLGGDERGEG